MSFHLSLTAALGATLLIATSSFAEDVPKTGVFNAKDTSTGSYRFFPVGDGGSHLSISEQTGKIEGEGLLNSMMSHCFGVGETVKLVNETHGYCIDRDKDGDQIIFRTSFEKHPWNSAKMRGSGIAMLGTGKYEGIVASYIVACEASGPVTGYTMECDGQGSYMLP